MEGNDQERRGDGCGGEPSAAPPNHPSPNELTILPTPTQSPNSLTLVTEPDDHMQTVDDLITHATRSIDLVMYQFNDPHITQELADAQSRGVIVRVMLNPGYSGKILPMQSTTKKFLESHNIQVHYTPDYFALTHQKTLIIDQSKIFLMTFNFVAKYYPTGRDFGIIDTDPRDVAATEVTFTADWNHQKINSAPGISLIWSPGAETAMVLAIKRATKTLEIYNEEMADDTITESLCESAQHGVFVQVVMTYKTLYKPAFNNLVTCGVHVATYASSSKKRYIHAKTIIVDHHSLFLGSQNFSWYSLEKNRELGIFITDQTILAKIEKVFKQDYINARIYHVSEIKKSNSVK